MAEGPYKDTSIEAQQKRVQAVQERNVRIRRRHKEHTKAIYHRAGRRLWVAAVNRAYRGIAALQGAQASKDFDKWIEAQHVDIDAEYWAEIERLNEAYPDLKALF